MKLRTLFLSGAVLSLAAAGGAWAQSSTPTEAPAASASDSGANKIEDAKAGQDHRHGRHHGHGGRMARLDKNGDGAIQPDEMGQRRTERLKAADEDGDGTLSQDEIEQMVLKQMVERRAKRTTRRLDVDGDGTVTLAEIEGRQKKRFALMDSDDDGKLDRKELRRANMMKGHHGNRHGHGMKRHHGKHGWQKDGGWRD